MTKLSDITGYAENWPKKQPSAINFGDKCVNLPESYGFNAFHDQTSSLGIGIDARGAEKTIEETLYKMPMPPIPIEIWRSMIPILKINITNALAANPQKFLRIEKASHE